MQGSPRKRPREVNPHHFNTGRTRTRPCNYCGRFYFDQNNGYERLLAHEAEHRAAGARGREERPGRPGPLYLQTPRSVQQPRPVVHYHQQPRVIRLIDRTVEEFGEDYEVPGALYPPLPLPSHNNNHHCSHPDQSGPRFTVLRAKPSAARPAEVTVVRGRGGERGALRLDHTLEAVEEDCTILLDPARLPNMPRAIIAVQSNLESYLAQLTEQEWCTFMKVPWLAGEEVREVAPPNRKSDDPQRLDCRYCGLIFPAHHVRKFHEESHSEESGEDGYDDGEDTRLFCGFCGKWFTRVLNRKLHERGHGLPGAGVETPQQQHLSATPRPRPPPRPAPPKVDILSQFEWLDASEVGLPKGWRMRTRPRPSQEGQFCYVFLSPDRKLFHSRKAVVQHMEKVGGYSQFELDQAKDGWRAKQKINAKMNSKSKRSKSTDIDLNSSSSSNLDDSLDGSVDEDNEDSAEETKEEEEEEDPNRRRSARLRKVKN